MKGKKLIISALIVVVLAAAAASFLWVHNDNSGEYVFEASLYFFNDKKASIIEEKRNINYDDVQSLPDKVLTALVKGPTNKKCVSPINKNVKILEVNNSEGDLHVDFSREYLSGDSSQDILSAYAVVKSLCSIGGVRRVKITVENKDIVAPDGNIIDYLADSDINISMNDDAAGTVVLYFPSKATGKLVTEVRNISNEDKKAKEQYIVNEIIKGPNNKELSPVLSADTTLISAETKDGVCYVNFKSDFIDKNSGDTELLAVYSIVDSLTELDNVQQIQILVDGKKVDNFGKLYIGNMFFRNEQLIERNIPSTEPAGTFAPADDENE